MNAIPRASTMIALLTIVGLFAIVGIVLLGFVDIGNPEIAKLTGLIVGWLTGLISPIVAAYFKNDSLENKPEQ